MELYTEESQPSSGPVALKNNRNLGRLKEKKAWWAFLLQVLWVFCSNTIYMLSNLLFICTQLPAQALFQNKTAESIRPQD